MAETGAGVPQPAGWWQADLFASLMACMQDGVLLRDDGGALLDVSPSFCRMTGFSPEEIRAAGPAMPFWPEEELDAIGAAFEQYMAGETGEYDLVFKRRDGERFPVLVTASPLRDRDGRILGYAAIVKDVTDRRRVEDERTALLAREQAARTEAEATRAQLAFLAGASSALAASLDYQTTLASVARLAVPHLADWCMVDVLEENGVVSRLAVAHADPAHAALALDAQHGWRIDPAGAHPVANVLRTGVSELYPEISEALLAAAARFPDQFLFYRELPITSCMYVPLRARGRTMGVMSFKSVESRRRYGPAQLALAEDLARRAAMAVDNARLFALAEGELATLEAASRTKDEFLATISHELRTPLTSMLGWTQMLRSGRLDAESSARALETIERNTQLLAQLVDDLLDVSRIITGKLRLRREEIDLVTVVARTLDVLRPAAEAKAIQLDVSFGTSREPIQGDPDRLHQIVWNLVSNAIKFTPADGRVSVELARADADVSVTVADTGQGIPPDFLPYVFDRFRQADATTTRMHGGLGLGLAIVRHLTELHGGTIRAESAGEGRGATFIVTLPIVGPRDRRRESPADALSAPRS